MAALNEHVSADARIQRAFQAMNGPYEWGRRDCLRGAHRMAEATSGRTIAVPCKALLEDAPSEMRLFMRAVRTYGGVSAAYREYLTGLGCIRLDHLALGWGCYIARGPVVLGRNAPTHTTRGITIVITAPDGRDYGFSPRGMLPVISVKDQLDHFAFPPETGPSR